MEDPSSIETHPEAVVRKYDGGAPTAADERSKDESRISLNRSSDPPSSSSSSSEEEKDKEESKETIIEDVPPPTETEEQTEDVEGPLLLSGSRAVRRPPRPPVGTGRPPQHN